ncbi:MAG: DUF2971 domain-containing protein [Gallionella sp.]
MPTYPAHFLPNWSEDIRDDALFHYTTAAGLAGIFDKRAIWSTAYYCANDEQELAAGKGVLTGIFRQETFELEKKKDKRIRTFLGRGVDPLEYADKFENSVTSMALNALCAYITCFCRPTTKEDFHHGLLSQWRGYGLDGGYALQFSRKKLQAALQPESLYTYELKDVHYSPDNELKVKLLGFKSSFIGAFHQHLDQLAAPLDSSMRSWQSPLPKLLGGPLESLLDYLVYTKNQHFAEEKECRMCAIQPTSSENAQLPVCYFNRSGLLVPYISTPPKDLDLLDCVEWIIIGPGPRIEARFKSINQLIRQSGKDIQVRVSHIPYTRL